MADSHGTVPAQSSSGGGGGSARDHGKAAPARLVALGGDQIQRLSAALEDAFSLDGLRQLLRTGLHADVSVNLDAVVPVQGRNLHEICYDLVLWALADERVGLHGLLAAALAVNPANPRLVELQQEWAGVTFTAPTCPYPGMQPFTAAEQARFYGRKAEIGQAVDRLRRHPFLAVIGPSGSGKSSLLAAGILPALAESHHFAPKPWVVHTMRPGATPRSTLAGLVDLPVVAGAPAAGTNGGPPGADRPQPVVAGGRARCWSSTNTRSCSP